MATPERAQGFFSQPGATFTRMPSISMSSDKAEDAGLLETYSDLRTAVFQQFMNAMTADQFFYQMKFGADLLPKDWTDRGFKPTLPPTAYNAVEAASDHMLTTPDIFVPERPNGQDYEREQVLAELKGQFLEFWWAKVAAMGDPIAHGRKNLIRDGKIVIKKEIDWSVVDFKGATVQNRFPWKVRLLNNFTVFEDPNSPYDPNYVFEAFEIRCDAAKAMFPEAGGAWRTRKAADLVRIVEYWSKPSGTDKGRRVLWVEDERVVNKVNPYHWVGGVDDKGRDIYDGYVPYFISDSMWGDGSLGVAPHDRYVGLIRYVHSLIETEARQLSAADAQLRIGTFPIVLISGVGEDDEKPIKVAPGTKIYLEDPKTQDVKVLQWPQLDPALFGMITRVHQYTNELSKFESLSGIPQRGVDTATEAQQLSQNASSKLQGPLAGLRSLMMRINMTILADIEKVLEASVAVTGHADDMPGTITIAPDDITGGWETFVELSTSDQAALSRANLQTWGNAFGVFQGSLDAEYAMKMAGIKNPKQRRARARLERFEDDPRMYELQFAEYVQSKGGPFAERMALGIVDRVARGEAPPFVKTAAGSFPDTSESGLPSNRRDPDATPQGEAGQDIRATAFGQALQDRPDLQQQ